MKENNIEIEKWKEMAYSSELVLPLKFHVRGISMTPLIRNQMDEVMVIPLKKNLKKGDIVLVDTGRQEHRFILHRIYKMTDNEVQTIGDGNLYPDAWVSRQAVLGYAVGMIRDGSWYDLEHGIWKMYGFLWQACLPVRGMLLTLGCRGKLFLKR